MILASKSPRRKEILEEFGFTLKIETKEIEESSDEKNPFLWAEEIALKKGKAVAESNKNDWIISADTVVVYEGEFLGKPKDEEEAENVLKKLSGNSHEVITAVAIINIEKKIEFAFSDVTKVYFKNISDSEIKWYIKSKEPMDKAGSYGVQGKGSIFIEKIEGDFFNVMGFPISKFYDKLKELNYDIDNLYKI